MGLNANQEIVVAYLCSKETKGLFSFLRALALANDVELVHYEPNMARQISGFLTVRVQNSEIPPIPFSIDISSFTLDLIPSEEAQCKVKFSCSSKVPRCFRGRIIYTFVPEVSTASLSSNEEVLAEVESKPLWTSVQQKGTRHDRSISNSTWIFGEEKIFQHLNGRYFMRLLPLIEWFRYLSDWYKWKKPGLRACFMFDDPNLHSERYGWISFKEIAEHGRRNHYHTSFAMIPIDSYYASRKAVRFFLDNPKELSLLIHGNDHKHRELQVNKSREKIYWILKQALFRISNLEYRTGLQVARVMAPPYGVFSIQAMKACATLGFEAACVSWGSIWSSNRDQGWTLHLGAESGRMIEGLPVIPRFRMSEGIENQILLSAYLEQPIVPVGHHWDVAGGIELISKLADFINGLGEVAWSNMTKISRSNFWWRINRDAMEIRPFSRLMEVNVPDEVSEIRILTYLSDNLFQISAQGIDPSGNKIVPHCEKFSGRGWIIDTMGLKRLNIKLDSKVEIVPQTSSFKSAYNLCQITRRTIREIRDRLMPYFSGRRIKNNIVLR